MAFYSVAFVVKFVAKGFTNVICIVPFYILDQISAQTYILSCTWDSDILSKKWGKVYTHREWIFF